MRTALLAFGLCGLVGACDLISGSGYTLYRNSIVTDGARIHVASFDAKDGEAYNRENCDVAAVLFNGQEGVRTKFWCEKGRYRP
ncbi:hypothetical protein [Methylobacterium soli]|uniref:Lipoprotein n=1 Tax=Methylobacterium soli TaxID=553447 RepID=A0A6L3SXH8_9HYPH|nr:hypothetical protein [Methylobacterium soli]KAB1077771.1 hypothetical protein F6X53_17585 [Methylobacterium soli]GJE42897.1 hypothetical protein AEGHOMDF_2071 [Methylobacterium soli]